MVDLVTTIQSRLDPSGFKAGMDAQVQAATQGGARIAAAGDVVVASQTRVGRAVTGNAAAWDRTILKYDQAARQTAELTRIQEIGARAMAFSNATQADVNRVLALAEARHQGVAKAIDAHGVSAGNTAFAMRQLGVQSVQAISGIATGQGVLQVLIQQGHQVGDVMLSTGSGMGVFGAAAKAAFGALVSPVGLMIVAAAGITAVGIAAESSARRIGELGNRLSLIRSDYAATATAADRAAKQLAATSFLGTSDARAGVNAALSAGVIDPQKAAAVSLEMARLALRIGDVAEAAKMTGDVVRDPAGFLEGLLKAHPQGLVAINQQLLNSVRDLQNAGQSGEALRKTLEAITRQNALGKDSVTPWTEAVRKLENALTGGGQAGQGLAEKLGAPIVNMAANFVTAIASIVTAIEKAINAIPPWLVTAIQKGSTLALDLNPVTGSVRVLTGTNTLLNGATGAGGSSSASVTSPAATAAGMVTIRAPGGASFTVSQAAAPAFQGLINDLEANGYPINSLDVSSWRPGATVAGTGAPSRHSPGEAIDVNASRNRVGTEGDIPAELARSLAAKWGVSWGGDFRNPDPMHFGFDGRPSPTLRAAGAVANPNPEGGPTSPWANLVAPPTTSQLLGEVESGRRGTPAERYKAAEDELAKVNKLLGGDGLDTRTRTGLAQRADELQKALYDAVTPAEALNRQLGYDTAAETRMTEAWGKGATAAGLAANQIKAEGEARQIAGDKGAQYLQLVARLTAAYNLQAVAAQRAKVAEASADTRDQTALLQLEIDTLGMDAEARRVVVEHLRNEQAVRKELWALSPAEQEARIRELDQLGALTAGLQRQQAGLDALASGFTSAFDTIGNAMTQAFVGGQGAAVNWKNVMTSVIQQVIQQFFKLAVLNPVLNSMGMGGANGLPTVSTVGAAIGQQAANGTGLGGMLANTALGRLFGLGGAGAAGAGFTPAMAGEAASLTAAQSASGAYIDMATTFHKGGLVGFDAAPTRYVHPSYFDDAPRFHQGLGGDEFAAILQRGERVLTARQQGQVAAASGAVTNNFHFTLPGITDRQTGDSFMRAAPAVMRAALDAQTRARSRNG